ncbi:vWA domain-containing protein [Roseimaritima ulvae]|uniref:VWFA domain-containing protein n=1 Tax=Roseimaritima ulvae TaxID=980254 RepID=A0A5B9QRD4_9BACT|nr:VWA domain-containing protein [Roseimaritima ulvae]QEG41588.1 hypothetical protein UC8_36130 [Roseimaritima ulvae]
MFQFNSPDRWIWVLAALPIVAFFLLRTRLRHRRVATLLFWEQVFHQKRSRALGTRLRHVGSLLLQLAFLGLVVLALLDPLGPGQGKLSRRIVLVVDTSASMQARDADGLRWEAALEAAEAEVKEMRAGDQMALIAAGSPAQVVVGMTEFGPSIRQALQTLQPSDAPAQIDQALDKARQLASEASSREIVLVSDGCFAESTHQRLTAASHVRLQRVGQSAANIGITGFQTRRSQVDPIGYAVWIEVVNHSDDPQERECRLTLELDEQLVDVLPLRLKPGQPWRKTFTDADVRGGVLTARLDVVGDPADTGIASDTHPADALALDNRAVVILPPRPALPVNLVTESENLFLAGGLSAIPRVQLTASPQPIKPRPRGGITVFHRLVPEELPDGPLLFIDPQQDAPFWRLGRPIAEPVVAQQQISSPLLAHVQLTNVSLPGARRLQMRADSTTLLSTADGSVMMSALLDADDPGGTRRVVVLSTQLDDGDLPLRVAFPVMLTNVITWLSNASPQLQPALSTGQQTMAGGAFDAALGPLQHVGIKTLEPSSADGDESRRVAVNLANAQESDLRQHVEPAAAAPPVRRITARSVWFTLCLLALGFIVSEWVLYQRRMVG